MYICVYILHIFIFIQTYVRVHMYMHAHIYTYIYMSLFIQRFIDTCIYIYFYMYNYQRNAREPSEGQQARGTEQRSHRKANMGNTHTPLLATNDCIAIRQRAPFATFLIPRRAARTSKHTTTGECNRQPLSNGRDAPQAPQEKASKSQTSNAMRTPKPPGCYQAASTTTAH